MSDHIQVDEKPETEITVQNKETAKLLDGTVDEEGFAVDEVGARFVAENYVLVSIDK